MGQVQYPTKTEAELGQVLVNLLVLGCHPLMELIDVKINSLTQDKRREMKNRHREFTWFGTMPTFTGGDRESSIIK